MKENVDGHGAIQKKQHKVESFKETILTPNSFIYSCIHSFPRQTLIELSVH